MRWARHVVRRGRGEVYYRVLVRKPEGKRPLRKARRRWKNDINLCIQEVECGRKDWISLSQDRDWWQAIANEVMNFRAP
jgi:hypothetical protein